MTDEQWLSTLTAAQRERLDRCMCGSVAAILKGRRSWVRSDILCPECDGIDWAPGFVIDGSADGITFTDCSATIPPAKEAR